MPPRGWAKLTAMPHAVMGVRHGWGWNGKSNVFLRVKAVRGREGLCGGYVPGRARSGKSCSRSLDKGVLNGNEFQYSINEAQRHGRADTPTKTKGDSYVPDQ